MVKLLYQGHGSFRITTNEGVVIYVDPYVGDGYEVPADIILVTHQHGDHNQIHLVNKKETCRVITNQESLADDRYNTFSVEGVTIEAVPAKNKNHNPRQCVGYLITINDIIIYAAGDTSKTAWMETLQEQHISCALLPCDGVYNMDLEEAAECARIIGAKHNIPIHMKPGALFDRTRAEGFNAPNRMILEPGQEIEL